MTLNPRPLYRPVEAAAIAMAAVGFGVYKLQDGGDCQRELGPKAPRAHFDCWGLVCKAYGLKRHRPGYNHGAWSTVSDDINGNSAIEDALHAKDLFEIATGLPRVGDVLSYPTIRIQGHQKPWIGHGAICVGVSRVIAPEWNPKIPAFSQLDIVECHGPEDTFPAIRCSYGGAFWAHSVTWPKPEHRSYLLRVRP